MAQTTTLTFYRWDGPRCVVCGHRELSDAEASEFGNKRVHELLAAWDVIDDFNADRVPEDKASAFRFGNLTVVMARP